MEDVRKYFRTIGFTLTHGDFHAENIFIRTPLPESAVQKNLSDFLILDWQVAQISDPVRDIAQLIR